MWKRGGYTKGFLNRLGIYKKVPAKSKKRIWIHAVSVGELFAISKLLEKIYTESQYEIFITTTTSTGFAVAKEKYSPIATYIAVFPIDFVSFSNRAWETIQPDLVILMESEIWPEHLYQAKRRKIPTILANARISDRSYRRYKKVPFIQGLFLKRFDRILASTEQDYQRILGLKIPKEKVVFAGNLKFDVTEPSENIATIRKEIRKEFFALEETDQETLIVLGSSTWPGEERTLIQVFKKIQQKGIPARLILVPRHAERRNEIVNELRISSLKWQQRSLQALTTDPETMIYLADTTGELKYITQVSDVAFIGKSMFPNSGGQTPIEAASMAIPMLFGPNMNNFKDISKSLIEAGAAVEVKDAWDLETQLIEILRNPATRNQMGEAGTIWHRNNLGATDKTITAIHELEKS
jgi:3-deoxy-D-manno-octulosonic-acid transferase